MAIHRRCSVSWRAAPLPAVGLLFLWLCSSATTVGQDQPQPLKPKSQDNKLGERLIRKATSGAEEDLMTSIIRLMDEAAHRLEIEFDAGDKTQALQQRIMDQLEKAIQVAASQRRPMRSRQQRPRGDKRKMVKERPPKAPSLKEQPGVASSRTTQAGTTAPSRSSSSGDLRETRRTWGHLPMRHREEIIQGAGERFLERYRAWIERYYRALQEPEK